MRAVRISQYGDLSVLQIEEIDKPEVSAGKVLVKVMASSVNPFDTKIRAGQMKDLIHINLPVTLGSDIAGIVEQVGDGVNSFKPGDKVFGQAGAASGNSGAFAEHAVTSINQIALMPSNLEFNEAASLPLVGASAVQAIEEHIKLKPNQKIFIHGGAGGIGSLAIQLAKHIGAYIATTATGKGVEYVKELGADEVIDYTKQDFLTLLSGYDAVFDTVGGDDFNRSLAILTPGSTAVSMVALVDRTKARELGINSLTQATSITTEKLEYLKKLVENGTLKPCVDSVHKLEDIKTAFEIRESGEARSKVVVDMGQGK